MLWSRLLFKCGNNKYLKQFISNGIKLKGSTLDKRGEIDGRSSKSKSQVEIRFSKRVGYNVTDKFKYNTK